MLGSRTVTQKSIDFCGKFDFFERKDNYFDNYFDQALVVYFFFFFLSNKNK